MALLVARRGDALRLVLDEVVRSGWRPALVTVVYVVVACLGAGGGLAADLARDAQALAGGSAFYLAPLLGGLNGFLTGSNTASNDMMMPVQTALARTAGVNIAWAAAIQNVAGSTFTMLSPARIATGCALLGLTGQDRAAYGKTWPFAAVTLVILMVCWGAFARPHVGPLGTAGNEQADLHGNGSAEGDLRYPGEHQDSWVLDRGSRP